MADQFVVTVHLLGDIEEERQKDIFDDIDALNDDLKNTLNKFLKGDM